MDECRKAFEQLYDDFESDWEIFQNGWLAGMTARTEAKVSGEVVTREVLFPVFKSLVDRWVEKRDEIHEILSKRREDRLANFLADNFQLPAPQSPVVPSKRDLADLLRRVESDWSEGFGENTSPSTDLHDDQAEAIRAHLLANARESREKQGQELENCSNLLSLAVDFIRDKYKGDSSLQDIAGGIEEVMKTLATVGKEG